MTQYVKVPPQQIGWIRCNATMWLTNCGKTIELSFNNPTVEVPHNYPDLIK